MSDNKIYYKTVLIKIQKLALNVLLAQKHSEVFGKQETFMYCFNLFLFFFLLCDKGKNS